MRIKKRLFLILFMSFSLVVLFPIFVVSGLYSSIESTIKEDTHRANRAMMSQLIHIIDGKLQLVEQTSMKISFHPRVQLMLNHVKNLAAPSAYEYKQLVDILDLYKPSDDFIQDYYVYLHKQDVIVTSSIKTEPAIFYANYYNYEKLTENEWLEQLMKSDTADRYLPALSVSEKPSLSSQRLITYIRSLPYGERGHSKGALVILLKEEHISELLNNIDDANQAKILIIDQSGQLLTASGTGPTYNEAALNLEALLSTANNEISLEINGETMLVTTIVSQESGWSYVSLVPQSVLLDKVNRMRMWALSLLAIYLICGLIGAYILTKLNYSPVNRLVQAIQRNRNIETKRIAGEYELIEKTLLDSWKSEKQMQEMLDKQTPAIQSNFLHRFIKGLTDSNSLHSETFKFMGIHFHSDSFLVVIIRIDESSSKFSHLDAERQTAMIRFIVTNVSQELIERYHQAYAVELDRNRLALLVNLHPKRLLEAKEDIERAIKQLKSFIEHNYEIYTSIGVSEIHNGDCGVGSCYAEALMALDYRLVKGKSNVIYYNEISQTELNYYYPLEIEQQLMNAVKTGNFKSTNQLLDHIYQMNFGAGTISLEIGKCLYFNMISTLMKIWSDSTDRFEKQFGDNFNPVHQLAHCETFDEMHKQVKSIYKTMCELIQAAKKDPGVVLADNIAKYIAIHYADNALSLVYIADHFKLTPQYVSGFFKKHHGQNLGDFMAKLRVEHAKELLLNDNLTLKEIAHQVGYANDAGFIRVFKKYTGITPGAYRGHINMKNTSDGGN